MRYIENENFYWTNIDSQWYSNGSLSAVPMYVIPIPEGVWSVEITCEGEQPTMSTTEPNQGKQDGLIAYSDESGDSWNVGVYRNTKISNNKADNTWKYGHPDMVLNDCHFNNRQCLQRDGVISCHVTTSGPDASIFIVGPPVQKQARYNYAVGYGAWTERDMELGQITVTLDEHNPNSSGRGRSTKEYRRSLRRHENTSMTTCNLHPPVPIRSTGLGDDVSHLVDRNSSVRTEVSRDVVAPMSARPVSQVVAKAGPSVFSLPPPFGLRKHEGSRHK
jgi:hypothetical protein